MQNHTITATNQTGTIGSISTCTAIQQGPKELVSAEVNERGVTLVYKARSLVTLTNFCYSPEYNIWKEVWLVGESGKLVLFDTIKGVYRGEYTVPETFDFPRDQ